MSIGEDSIEVKDYAVRERWQNRQLKFEKERGALWHKEKIPPPI
jgi:hypothetical protein